MVLPPPIAVVLHYESASPARWLDKFTAFARFRRSLKHARKDGPRLVWEPTNEIERRVLEQDEEAALQQRDDVLSLEPPRAGSGREREGRWIQESVEAASKLLISQEVGEATMVAKARAAAMNVWESGEDMKHHQV